MSFVGRVVLGIAVALYCQTLVGCREAPAARHLVLVSLDTARADHFGFLGSAVRTPRLDALAAESVVLTDYVTVSPTTLASHTSLFTGNYPHHHGVPRNGFVVDAANVMLPERLREAGFRTDGFAASFALASRFGFAQGFDHYDEHFEIALGEGGADQNQRPAASVTDAVIARLDAAGIPERLFLFVHYFDAHQPYAAPPPWDTAYDPEGRGDLPLARDLRARSDLSPEMRERYAERLELQYAGEVSYLDEQLGRLFDALAERGILDEAVLVVTSDHGEEHREFRPRFSHGLSLRQPSVRAVGLVRLPGGRQGGTRLPTLAASVDLLPTLLAELGLPAPAGIDGEVLDLHAPTVGGPGDRLRFGQATMPWRPSIETHPRWINMNKARFVRDGRYKLIHTPFRRTRELYDLERDPAERRNLLLEPNEEVQATAARLGAVLERWASSADPLPSAPLGGDDLEEVRERLRALGYAEDGDS